MSELFLKITSDHLEKVVKIIFALWMLYMPVYMNNLHADTRLHGVTREEFDRYKALERATDSVAFVQRYIMINRINQYEEDRKHDTAKIEAKLNLILEQINK